MYALMHTCKNECMHRCFNSIVWVCNHVLAYWISHNKVSNHMFSVYRSEIFCVSVSIVPFVRAICMTLGTLPPHSCRDAGGRYAQRSRSIDLRWWALIEFVRDQRNRQQSVIKGCWHEANVNIWVLWDYAWEVGWDYIACVQEAYLTSTVYAKTSSYYLK